MTDEGATDGRIRPAEADDHTAVLNVLDAANLTTDAGAIRAAIDRDSCLVAEPVNGAGNEGVLVGALVHEGNEITHVAVRKRRRGQGIGTALVEAVAEGRCSIVTECPTDVRPFYEALGFEIEPADDDERLRGRWRSD